MKAKNPFVSISKEILELYYNIAAIAKSNHDDQTNKDTLRTAQSLLENVREETLKASWVNQPLVLIKQQLLPEKLEN